AAVLLQPEHREVAIPVVDLAEPAARHDVRVRERQKGGIGFYLIRLALQYIPHIRVVVADALLGAAFVVNGLAWWQREVLGDKDLQIEARPRLLLLESRQPPPLADRWG